MKALADTRGFDDPGLASQRIFRAVLQALAQPGSRHRLPPGGLKAPVGLSAGAAALALTLVDFETPLWLDPALAAAENVADYLKFHTGARIAADAARAAFAIASGPTRLPRLKTFALGTLGDPDRSTTLILDVEGLATGSGWRLTGPGIAGATHFEAIGFGPELLAERRALEPLLPRGLDILLVAGDEIAGLPRSTRIEG
jgi:alpha-D-ribose 1-methylphosphonate 5-triphosphate synthase subunit PhnH